MPMTKVRWTKGNNNEYVESPEALLARAESDPFFPYPYPFIRSMFDTRPRPDCVSVSEVLFECVSCTVLKRFVDYTENLDGMWRRWKGNVFHADAERNAHPKAVAEARFYAHVPGCKGELSGSPDVIQPLFFDASGFMHVAILDTKTTKNVPRFGTPYSNHGNQANTYGWLIRHAHRWEKDGEPIEWSPSSVLVDRLGIWYLDDEGPKVLEVTKSIDVPTKPGAKNATKKEKVPHIWSDEEAVAFIAPRMKRIEDAIERYRLTGELPPYEPDFDFIQGFAHRYSPVALECVRRHTNLSNA